MNAFIVDLENRQGELARVTEAVAAKGINIASISGAANGPTGAIALLTNDEAGTRRALQDAHCAFRELEIVPHTMDDRPGALAETARRLADANVNVEAILPLGMSGGRMTLGFCTQRTAAARDALGQPLAASTR